MSADETTCAPSAACTIEPEAAASLAGVFKSLSDPTRLRMLSAIVADPRGETCVCDLNALADVSQPTVSHHLRVLRQAGLLTCERRGTWVYYRIAPQWRAALVALLDAFAPATIPEAPAGA